MNKPGARAIRALHRRGSSRLSLEPGSNIRNAVKAALAAASSAAALLGPAQVLAGPQQGTVAAGNASISTTTPGHTQIDQTSSKAIINWGSFSIAPGESVTFAQPSSNSATLNRVIGSAKSIIDGALSANGQVLILNSAGVLFGHNAQVNVGSLIATTSDISNQDFLNGKLSFQAPGTAVGEVANEGSIRVSDQGLAALVAPTVRNSGVIQARLGKIALASGETFTVDLYGDHLINFAVGQAAGANSTRAVDQQGKLIADGGKVLISSDAAAGVVGSVVNLSGVIQARTVSQSRTGEIVLDASGATVNVTGTLDATGNAGLPGGTIDLDSADLQTSAGSRIDASALDQGNGGHIKLWGTNTLAVAGNVSARGGARGGSGGSLDLSTGGGLSVTGNVDLQAPNGPAGSLLLDPASITVADSGSADPTASVVGAPFLNRELQSGTNVTLSATDSITVDAAIDGRLASGAASHPSGSVSLTAGSLTIAAPIVTDRAGITLTATGTASGSGNINFTGSNLTGSKPNSGFLWVADCSTGCSTATIGNAAINLHAGGDVTADTSAASNGQLASLGAVTIDAGGNVSGLPALNGIATSNGAASGIGSLTVNASGTATLNGAKSNGAIEITAASITTGGSPLFASTGGVTLNAGSGGITVNAAQDANGNSSGVQSGNGGDVVFLTTGAVNVSSDVTAAGNLCIAGALASCSGGASTAAGRINAGNATLQAGSATGTQGITLVSTDTISASTLLLGSQGAADLVAANGVTVQNPIAGYAGTGSIGSLTVTAGGDVLLNGANVGISTANAPTAGGATIKITSGGNVSLTGAPLIARDDISIDLTAAGGGLTVNTSPSNSAGLVAGFGVASGNAVDPTNVLNSTASITLTRSSTLSQFNGPIVLKDGLLAAGSVNIGSATARVATVCGDTACASDAATIQAGANKTGKSSIAIFANGQVSASTLLVGESGGVTLDSGGSVSVSQPLAGFSSSLGIGSLTATSGQNLTLDGGTIGDAPAVTAGQGTVTLSAANQFTTGGHSLIARDGISITAGSTVTLDAVSGGAALVAGYDGTGAYDAIAGHVPTVQIDSATNSGSLKINTDGGILSAGDVLIGSRNRVGQVTAVATPGAIQAGDPTNNGGAGVSIFANGPVELGPVLVGPQGSISVNPTDTNSSTSGSVTFDKGLYGFSSGATQLGIGSLTVDSKGTIAIPGVQANQNITVTGYTPAATVHGGFIASPGDVTALNGQGPWTAGGNVQITLDSGDLTFNLPQNAPGNRPFDLTSTTGSIDIEGAGQVLSPNGISAGKAVLIGATTPVASVNLGAVRSSTVGSQDPSIVNATGTIALGPWMGGQDEIIPSSGVRNAPIAGGVSVLGSTITTAGIAGFQAPTECCFGVSYITLNGSQGVTVNGLLVSFGIDPATGSGIGLYAGPGKTIALNQSLVTSTENYLSPGGLTPLGAGGPVVIGDKNGYPADPLAVAPVKIDLSADVLTINKDITFDGDVTLFSGVALNHASAVQSPFFKSFTSSNPSSSPQTFPETNFNHITDLLVDPQNNVLAQPTEPNLANYFSPPDQRAGNGNDTAGWSKGLGELTAVIDAGTGTGAGKVTFNGSVVRDLPSSIPSSPGAVKLDTTPSVNSNCSQPCDMNELTLLPSYVNVVLVAHGSSVIFNGTTGDPVAAENAVLGAHDPVIDFNTNTQIGYAVNAFSGGLPALGYFKIDVSGIGSNGTAFSGWSCANAALCANYVTYDPSLVSPVNQTPPTPIPNVVNFYYRFDDTNQGQQDIGLSPQSGTSTIPVAVGNIYGTGAFASNPLQPNAASGTGASGAIAGTGANGATAAILGGADLSVTSTTAAAEIAAVDGVTTADARRQHDAETEQSSNTTTDACPRGAGPTADLGTRPGVAGASPNVFTLCRPRTEVAYRTPSP